MQIQQPTNKGGGQQGESKIGYWKAECIAINPSAKQLQEIYGSDEPADEEPKYSGEDKNGDDYQIIKFYFRTDLTKDIVSYAVFVSKKEVSFENKDKVQMYEFLNQWGNTQMVESEDQLWDSFKYLQKWNKDEKKFTTVMGEDGNPVKLDYRKAYKGEGELYSLLRNLINQDWFNANEETTIMIKINDIMKGKLGELTSLIGTDNMRMVVGMNAVEVKDTDDGKKYYSNPVPKAWMTGSEYAKCGQYTQANNWAYLGTEEAKKGKGLAPIRNFYYQCQRSKHIVVFKPIATFSPEDHLVATDNVIASSDAPIVDADY